MSDEDTEPTWFPPELRDYWSASVTEMLAELVLLAAIAVAISSVGIGKPQPPDADLPWSAIVLVVAHGVGLFVCFPATLILLDVTTRYRQLGMAVPYATILFALCYLVVSSPDVNSQSALATLGFCLSLAISSGQYTRRPKPSPPPLRGRSASAQHETGGGLPNHPPPANSAGVDDLPRKGGGEENHRRFLALLGRYWWFKRAVVVANAAVLLPVVFLTRTTRSGEWLNAILHWYLFFLSALLCAWCWLRLFRPFLELAVEPAFRVLYRMRASGPGVKAVPPLGPVLVVANHACWFDPCFVAEFIPRPITPMMTSRFFNKWFLRPLLKHVFRVIVVPDAHVRREAPELRLAIEALARGECVVIFPEGYLQRKAEVPLRRFGQGVWHILSARPDTPVVACWVEGGWGSKFSYHNGPPGKNKRMDFRRPIRVGVNEPEVIPADVLADQMATRIHLMNRVSAARVHVGLLPLPTVELPAAGEAEKEPAQPEPSS